MSPVYNANEIYRMGVEIEKNGRQFYTLTSQAATDSDIKKLLGDLAAWEGKHVELFEGLQRELPATAGEEAILDPDNDMQKYLKAIADSHVFLQKNIDIKAIVKSCESVIDVLSMALRFEKDSVVLYTAMRDMVPADLGQSTIARLASEEISHVSMIQTKLTMLTGEE